MKTTKWFPGHIKPVRAGIYQVRGVRGDIGYQHWDGNYWYYWSESPYVKKFNSAQVATCYQNDAWRGLAQEPKP